MSENDNEMYQVVINEESRYSIWLLDREIPYGWEDEGFHGTKEECLAHIKEVWTDMRPRPRVKKE